MGLFRDKHFHVHHTSTVAPAYPQTIHEHRAPTDESVKLLREMEEAARQSVMEVYQFEDNDFSGIVVVLKAREPSNPDDRKLYVRFTLNGKQYEFESKMDGKLAQFSKMEAYELLVHGVRDAILEQLLPHIGKALTEDK